MFLKNLFSETTVVDRCIEGNIHNVDSCGKMHPFIGSRVGTDNVISAFVVNRHRFTSDVKEYKSCIETHISKKEYIDSYTCLVKTPPELRKMIYEIK